MKMRSFFLMVNHRSNTVNLLCNRRINSDFLIGNIWRKKYVSYTRKGMMAKRVLDERMDKAKKAEYKVFLDPIIYTENIR